MPYVYRYIDLTKAEVIYVGKVTLSKDNWYDPVKNRHEQHKREEWYKNLGKDNVVMQYVELDCHADADCIETLLISYYDTGQLLNKAKTGWGRTKINPYNTFLEGKQWKTFNDYDTKASSVPEAFEWLETRQYERLTKLYNEATVTYPDGSVLEPVRLYASEYEVKQYADYIIRQAKLQSLLCLNFDFKRREESNDDYKGTAEHEADVREGTSGCLAR